MRDDKEDVRLPPAPSNTPTYIVFPRFASILRSERKAKVVGRATSAQSYCAKDDLDIWLYRSQGCDRDVRRMPFSSFVRGLFHEPPDVTAANGRYWKPYMSA